MSRVQRDCHERISKQSADRYQQSPQERIKHAERQRRYRDKQRIKSDKVTHQGISVDAHVIPVAPRCPATYLLDLIT